MNLENLVVSIGATTGAILKLDVVNNSLQYAETYNVPDTWQSTTYSLASDNLYSRAIRSSQPVVANHIHQERDGTVVNSALVVPIFKTGKIIGVIELTSMDPSATFNEDDREQLEALARSYATLHSHSGHLMATYAICSVLLLSLAPGFGEARIGFAASNVPASTAMVVLCYAAAVYAALGFLLIKKVPAEASIVNACFVVLLSLYFFAASVL